MNEDRATVGLPRLRERAPDFRAETTLGPRSLADYRGSWLVLFSHPADFTPVCTTEFLAFAAHYPRFRENNCELLGLSIDSTFSHIAWTRNIRKNFGVEIPFPIIADLTMTVARAYGMMHPGASDTSAVRAVFVIDAEGILRAMLYYPLSNGRSVAEILRLVQAIQVTDRNGTATPEGWKPGDAVMAPPPKTATSADERMAEDLDCVDWYFCRRSLEDVRANGEVGRAPVTLATGIEREVDFCC